MAQAGVEPAVLLSSFRGPGPLLLPIKLLCRKIASDPKRLRPDTRFRLCTSGGCTHLPSRMKLGYCSSTVVARRGVEPLIIRRGDRANWENSAGCNRCRSCQKVACTKAIGPPSGFTISWEEIVRGKLLPQAV